MAAIRGGQPVDTTMGFSPLEGLVMATRSGDVDAAIVPYLAARLGVTAERIVEMLNHEAGLKGVSGISSDLRELAGSADARARLAVDLYCYRARKYLGASFAALGGCDGVVFGGGVGEHMPEIRARILDSLGWAGVELDTAANQAARGAEASVGRPGAAVSVHVIPVDEEHTLATAALRLVTRPV
jgi:acetate kinase